MTYRVLHAGDAVWRPSTLKGVPNTDLAGQLGAATLGARTSRSCTPMARTRCRRSWAA